MERKLNEKFGRIKAMRIARIIDYFARQRLFTRLARLANIQAVAMIRIKPVQKMPNGKEPP